MERRLYEHNIGHSKFTATGVPWKLKYTKVFDTLLEAKRYEMAIKKMKSFEKLLLKTIATATSFVKKLLSVEHPLLSVCLRLRRQRRSQIQQKEVQEYICYYIQFNLAANWPQPQFFLY